MMTLVSTCTATSHDIPIVSLHLSPSCVSVSEIHLHEILSKSDICHLDCTLKI